MPKQIPLFDKTDEEKVATLHSALVHYGRHSLYCCWDREHGLYDRSLGCTCGLQEALEEVDDGR